MLGPRADPPLRRIDPWTLGATAECLLRKDQSAKGTAGVGMGGMCGFGRGLIGRGGRNTDTYLNRRQPSFLLVRGVEKELPFIPAPSLISAIGASLIPSLPATINSATATNRSIANLLPKTPLQVFKMPTVDTGGSTPYF
eukprot:768464-Hanusia_phi.AAC.10